MPSRAEWNRRYAAGSHTGTVPSAVVERSQDYWPLLPEEPRRALDLAAGAGRNSLYLARNGFAVTALDWSVGGLAVLRERAAQTGLSVDCQEIDLESPGSKIGPPVELVVVTDFLHRPLLTKLGEYVVPGGLIAYETYNYRQREEPKGPSCDDYLLGPGELLESFAGWRVLVHEESVPPVAKTSFIAQAP